MPEAAAAAGPGDRLTAVGGTLAGALPFVSLGHLLSPKWLSMRARMVTSEKGRASRMLILGVTGLLFWLVVYRVLLRLLVYFRDAQDIGALLAGKLMGLILIGFLSILLLSNIIGSLSTFFLARDLDTLVAAPLDWFRFYVAKLTETMAHSSWMVVLMSIPIFAAYGVAYEGGVLYPVVALAVFVPFLVLPAIVGSALTLLLVNVFPARRTKDILAVIAVLAAAGLALLFRLVRPEQLAGPEGFESLMEFVAVLRTPTSPFLPSEWVQSILMSWLAGTGDGDTTLLFALLWLTAASFVVLGAWAHGLFYHIGFSRAQESGGVAVKARGNIFEMLAAKVFGLFGTTRRELLMKEVRIFFRDTTQWSQLILLAVLVVVYVFNIRYLPLHGEGVSLVLRNLIPFLNLGLTGFVIASIAARFIFPGVSLEGRTLWLLRSSPLEMKELLWSKFWIGTAPLLVLALLLSGLTNFFLGVSQFMFLLSTFTITFMTLALASMALCFGTIFPQFDSENAAQIPTSFGGLLFMMASVALIGAVIILEARPVYMFLESQRLGENLMDVREMVIGFGAVLLLCGSATIFPVRLALRRLEAVER